MFRPIALIAVVILAAPAAADDKDWTGKTVRLKEPVKLGSKLGGGLVRDGETLDKSKTYVVKSDDGSYLELVGQKGFIFKSDAEVTRAIASSKREMPKKGDPVNKDAKDLWAVGTAVLPKKRSSEIQFGDRDEDGKPTYFELSGIMPMHVRLDKGDGWIRIHDGHQEGWVGKDDLVTKGDAPIYFDKAVKANPKDTWALFMRGNGWLEKDEPDNALKDFNECIRLDPGDSSAYVGRGNARYVKKEYDKAIEDYTEAARLDPKSAIAAFNRGLAWHAKKEYDKAIEDYTEAARLDPKYVRSYYDRGLAWADKKEYDKAITDYTKAIELDPNQARVFRSRGFAWSRKKEHDKAIEDYTKAIEIDPTYVNAYNGRGIAWRAKKEYDKAIEDYTKAIKLDSQAAFIYRNRGFVWTSKKEYNRAIEDYTEAIRIDPKYVGAYIGRGFARYCKKEYDKAIEDFDKVSELDPKSVYGVGNKATALVKLKKYEQAAEAFVAGLKLEQADWLQRDYALFLASCPEERYRDGKKAVELAKKAIEKAGKDADWEYYAALAAAYAEADDFEFAIVEQRKVLEDKSLDKDDKKRMEARLELYRAKKPYRDEEK